MSWRVRALLLLFVGIWAWLQTPYLTVMWHQWLASVGAARNVTTAIPSTAYLLRDSQWLEFNIPPGATALRILTNAAVTDPNSEPGHSLQRDRVGWRYAVDYQLCDELSQPVESRTYHLRASLQQYEDSESGSYYGMTWFQGSNQLSARTCTISLPLTQQAKRPQRLRVRLSPAKADVTQVVARVYMRTERPQYSHPYTWARLSEKQRDRLCRASVYPPDLISLRERRNLLRWNWSALPPRGRADLDFQQRRIYQQETVPTSSDRTDPFEEGLELSSNQLITFILPLRAASVQIEASWLTSLDSVNVALADSAESNDRAPQPLTVRWYPADPKLPAQSWQIAPEEADDFEIDVDGGLLELQATDRIAVHPTWSPNELTNDPGLVAPDWIEDDLGRLVMTPSIKGLRAYTVDQSGELRYTVNAIFNQPTPCRVTLRQLLPASESATTLAASATVTCQWRDANNDLVREMELPVPSQLSLYDHADFRRLPSKLSEPADYFFSIPAQVRSVVLLDPSGFVVATMATRPDELPRAVTLSNLAECEEQDAATAQKLPSWFTLQPDGYSQRINEGYCANLRIATRPDVRNLAIADSAGLRWEEEQPIGQWLGRHLLTPRSLDSAAAPSNWGVIYCPIAIDREVPIQWHFDDEAEGHAVRLIYDGVVDRDRSIQVWINGQLHHEFLPRAARGEIQLPEIPLDSKQSAAPRIRIMAEPIVNIYLSRAEVIDTPLFVKRMAIQLEETPVEFELEKTTAAAQSWSLRAFTVTDSSRNAAGSAEGPLPIELETVVHGTQERTQGPFDGWTFRTRWIRFYAEDSNATLCLEGSTLYADLGQLATIQLGGDLPPGRYRVTIGLREPTERAVFISLNRPVPPMPTATPAATRVVDASSETHGVSREESVNEP